MKPDKGNGVVLININDYILCMTDLFSDKTKFSKVKVDSTLTQLNSLQNYLRTILNRGEISNSEYDNMRPISTQPARAHGLPKIHKSFDSLLLSDLSLTQQVLLTNQLLNFSLTY